MQTQCIAHFWYWIISYFLPCPRIRGRPTFTPRIWKADGRSRFATTVCVAFVRVVYFRERINLHVCRQIDESTARLFWKVTKVSFAIDARNADALLATSVFCQRGWRSLLLEKWHVVCEVILQGRSKYLLVMPFVIKRETCEAHVFSTCASQYLRRMVTATEQLSHCTWPTFKIG